MIVESVVLSDAFTDSIQRAWVQSRPGANQFNVNQFKFARKTINILVHEFVFPDDTAFKVHKLQDSQEIITRFSKSAKAFGLKIKLVMN